MSCTGAFPSCDTPAHKLIHVQHWNGPNTPWSYFCRDTNNQPLDVPGIKGYNGTFEQYWGQRCYSGTGSCGAPAQGDGGYYYCGVSPTWTFDFGGNGNHTLVNASFNNSIGDGNWHSLEWHYKLNIRGMEAGIILMVYQCCPK